MTQQWMEVIGRFVAIIIGTLMSPTWYLVQVALKPYMDVQTLVEGGISISEAIYVYALLDAMTPRELMYGLIPAIVKCLIASICFLLLCSFAGKQIGRLAYARFGLKAARS
jgi:hypothetical protein